MTQLNALEESLAKINKDLPAFPKGLKDFLVQVAPWLSLIGGLFSLATVYWMWDWAHRADALLDYANSISKLYGGSEVAPDRLGPMLWVSLIVVAVMGVIYLMAFKGLKDRKKSGWDLLFLATIVNLVFVIVSMFTDYSGYGSSLIGGLIGTAISWYVLFQIRDCYAGATSAKSAKA